MEQKFPEIIVNGVVYSCRQNTVDTIKNLLSEGSIVSRDPKHIELDKLKAPKIKVAKKSDDKLKRKTFQSPKK